MPARLRLERGSFNRMHEIKKLRHSSRAQDLLHRGGGFRCSARHVHMEFCSWGGTDVILKNKNKYLQENTRDLKGIEMECSWCRE